MKTLLPILLMAVAGLGSFTTEAQSKVTEGKVEYQKGDKLAAMVELPYAPDIVEDALKECLTKKAARNDRSKGFAVYRSVRIKEKDAEMNDLHFRVENTSDDQSSRVYLLIGRPGENMTLRTGDDRYKLEEAKSFLTAILPSVEAYYLEVSIKSQEEVVKKAERKMEDLQEDQRDLEKRIRNLQEKLEQNKGGQRKQSEDIMKDKTVLEALKGKRRATI